ncbi:hypothetical protein BST61_g11186 [Cercospora zeina]
MRTIQNPVDLSSSARLRPAATRMTSDLQTTGSAGNALDLGASPVLLSETTFVDISKPRRASIPNADSANDDEPSNLHSRNALKGEASQIARGGHRIRQHVTKREASLCSK